MVCMFKVAASWVVLMLIGTNVIGIIVRGFLRGAYIRGAMSEGDVPPPVAREITRQSRAGVAGAVLFILVGVGYLFALLRYLGPGVAVAGGVFILTRLPALLSGAAYTNKAGNVPGPIDFVMNLLDWAMVPLLWLSLC